MKKVLIVVVICLVVILNGWALAESPKSPPKPSPESTEPVTVEGADADEADEVKTFESPTILSGTGSAIIRGIPAPHWYVRLIFEQSESGVHSLVVTRTSGGGVMQTLFDEPSGRRAAVRDASAVDVDFYVTSDSDWTIRMEYLKEVDSLDFSGTGPDITDIAMIKQDCVVDITFDCGCRQQHKIWQSTGDYLLNERIDKPKKFSRIVYATDSALWHGVHFQVMCGDECEWSIVAQ